MVAIPLAWFLPNKETFRNIGAFMALAIPGTAMICLEWWCFEIMILMAGYIGVDITAAQIIVYNINSILFMIPLGM